MKLVELSKKRLTRVGAALCIVSLFFKQRNETRSMFQKSTYAWFKLRRFLELLKEQKRRLSSASFVLERDAPDKLITLNLRL